MIVQVQILAEQIITNLPEQNDVMQYVYMAAAAIIIIAAVSAILRAIPKWVFILAMVIVLVTTGYINVK